MVRNVITPRFVDILRQWVNEIHVHIYGVIYVWKYMSAVILQFFIEQKSSFYFMAMVLVMKSHHVAFFSTFFMILSFFI